MDAPRLARGGSEPPGVKLLMRGLQILDHEVEARGSRGALVRPYQNEMCAAPELENSEVVPVKDAA